MKAALVLNGTQLVYGSFPSMPEAETGRRVGVKDRVNSLA